MQTCLNCDEVFFYFDLNTPETVQDKPENDDPIFCGTCHVVKVLSKV